MTTTKYSPDILHKAELDFANLHNIPKDALYDIHRLREKYAHELPDSWHRIVVWIVAPTLVAYAGWMAQQARAFGQPRLLGVMREGRTLTRLMQALFNIPAQEIWLNRDLTMRAAFGCGDDEALINWLVRARLKPLTYAETTYTLTGSSGGTRQQIDIADAHNLIEQWRQNGQLKDIHTRCSDIAKRLMRHWQKTVPSDETPALLMDFACAGNIQRSLQTVLNVENNKTPVIGLNFGMTAGSHWAEKTGCKMHGFLSEHGEPAWFADAYARTPELMEIFTAPSLGSLRGYSEDGTPVLGESFLNDFQRGLMAKTQDIIVDAAAQYHREMDENLTADAGRCLWGRLLSAPLKVEVEALADWPLDAGLDGGKGRVLAARLHGQPEAWTKMQTAWPAASQLLSCEK